MKIRLLSVGKPRDARMVALHDEYAGRIGRLGVDYASPWVPEARAGGRYSDDHVREREARALRDDLGGRGTVIALDADGDQLSSERLASRIETWATPALTLLLGGPLGLHRALIAECAHVWSLSKLTFPHELARVVVAEQLYRALTLLRGIPYHK